jgi:predicted nucleotide-binding protein (sugar kinase/HSP70/actin superfamily)
MDQINYGNCGVSYELVYIFSKKRNIWLRIYIITKAREIMKIGIPNTLFAAYHLPYWQQFLNCLGMEVIISDDSRKEMIDIGGKMIPHEFCVPVKAFLGHVANLIAKKVDFILIPRMIGTGNRNFFCPKLTGLPEIVRYAAGFDEAGLFSPEVVCNGLDLKLIKYPSQKFKSGREYHKAEQHAKRYWEQTLLKCRKERLTMPEAFLNRKISATNKNNNIKLGLLGYAYTLYDPFISKGIIGKLAGLGAQLFTWEMIDPELIENRLKGLKRPLFWNFGRILLGAGLHFLEDPGVDGVIYVTTFGCGPDSIAIKLLSLEAGSSRKPFLQITLDEHSEDGHLKTRLEAFMDLLSAQKEDTAGESHFSLYGSGTRL